MLTYTDTSPVARGTKLGLQTYTDHVTVETPFTNLLPNDLDFTQTHFHRTEKTKERRFIYLRPYDVVIFQERACRIRIDVVDSSGISIVDQRSGNRSSATSEIQVKSSAQQPPEAGNSLVQETPADADTDDDDENDLDAGIATPAKADEVTPATSRPTDGIAVKDTPSRPLSRGSNLVFSTAPDKLQSQSGFDDIHEDEISTPAARARAMQSSRVKQQSPSAGSDSQLVFGNALRGQKTYGGTPKQKQRRQKTTPKKEILESPEKLRLDQPPNEGNDTGTEDEIAVLPGPSPTALKSSGDSANAFRNRKRKADEETAAKPLSTTPPTKKPRGGRQRKNANTAEDEDEAEHPPSTGKLRKPGRKSITGGKLEDDDEDDNAIVVVPRSKDNIAADKPSSTTPQSSGTHATSKPPSKILLSKSKFAEDKKAKAFLRKHNATIDDQVPGKRTNFVCVVGKGVLGTTAKVVRSLALGKKVVTDQWLEDCMSQDQLLDLEPYIHDDLRDTASVNRSKLFAGKTLFFTSALKSSYGDDSFANVEQLATEAGATNVESGTAKKAVGKSASTIFLGLEGDDKDALVLTEEGRTVYQKDLLTQSIIRGELLTDGEEFTWQSGSTKGRKGKKK